MTEGDITKRMEQFLPVIAHMQIADVPARNEPGTGEIGWTFVFRRMDELGYHGWVGCEYRPAGDTVAGLNMARANSVFDPWRTDQRLDPKENHMKIGFIGLGIMGRPMALTCKNAGH